MTFEVPYKTFDFLQYDQKGHTLTKKTIDIERNQNLVRRKVRGG